MGCSLWHISFVRFAGLEWECILLSSVGIKFQPFLYCMLCRFNKWISNTVDSAVFIEKLCSMCANVLNWVSFMLQIFLICSLTGENFWWCIEILNQGVSQIGFIQTEGTVGSIWLWMYSALSLLHVKGEVKMGRNWSNWPGSGLIWLTGAFEQCGSCKYVQEFALSLTVLSLVSSREAKSHESFALWNIKSHLMSHARTVTTLCTFYFRKSFKYSLNIKWQRFKGCDSVLLSTTLVSFFWKPDICFSLSAVM